MYNIENYWVFEHCPSSSIEKLENSVSEIGSVSLLRGGGNGDNKKICNKNCDKACIVM
jgi:hypothetical protein